MPIVAYGRDRSIKKANLNLWMKEVALSMILEKLRDKVEFLNNIIY